MDPGRNAAAEAVVLGRVDDPLGAEEQVSDFTGTASGSPADGDYYEPTETLVATITLDGSAGAIAVSPDGRHVYVACRDSVRVIGKSNDLVASVPVAGDPKNLVINAEGTWLYVTSYDGSVSVIHTADNTVRTISHRRSAATALGPDGAHLYAAYNATDSDGHFGSISVIDIDGQAIASVLVDNHVTDLAVAPDGTRLYALTSEHGSYYQYDRGALAAIDTATHTVIDTIAVGVCPDAVTVSPDGGSLYVTHPDTQSISAVDPATHGVKTIALQDTPLSATVTPDGTHVYVTTPRSLAVVDAATGSTETILVGDLPRRAQVSPDGKRVYITNFGDHTVSVLDAITNSVVTTLEVGGHPEELALSPEDDRLYVSDYWAGALAVIAIPSVTDRAEHASAWSPG